MRAVVFERYGAPEVMSLREIKKPVPQSNEVLVRVHAAAVNPQDWHCLRGTPLLGRLMVGGLFKPGHQVLGSDIAGTVEAVGPAVTQFTPGDAVVGMSFKHGAFAEFLVIRDSGILVAKPASLSFEAAAAAPMAGMMALMGLRDQAKIKAGDRILINGASGGIGTFAVQIAKTMGAHVTAVCGTRNVEMVQSLGADRVIDYTKEDFTTGSDRYQVIFDVVAKRTFTECQRVLAPKGIYVTTDISIGLLLQSARVALTSGQRMKPMLQKPTIDDLTALCEHIENGTVRPVIDRDYPLSEVPDAVAYVEQGHVRGKVVITIAEQECDSE